LGFGFGTQHSDFFRISAIGFRIFQRMKLGTVIGRVTLAKTVKALEGGRFLVVSPFSREQFEAGLDAPRSMGKDPSLVVYDAIGGGVGDVIGYEEGAEAAQPFEVPTPVDAINAALVDEMFFNPWK
jgi:carbon dioxide concentrating mechanism protein CcmL